MLKKQLKNLVCGVTLATLATTAQAQTTLKLASVAPTTSPWGKWATAMAEKINQVSGGELTIDLLLDAQAGDEQTILRQTMKGRMDIAFVSNVPMTLMAQELAIPSSAYLFDSPEQGTCVAYQHMANIFGDLMEDANMVPLTWMEVGHYVLFSKQAIHSPADLAGKKVRIAPSIADAAFAKALGTSGVPMGTSDAIPALQTGAVDAAWFPTLFGIGIGTHKVAPHITVTNHSRLIGSVAISKRTWNRLSEQEQEWLSLFTAAGPQLTAGVLGAEPAVIGKLEAAGIPVNRLNAEQLSQWQSAASGVLEAVIDEAGGQSASIAKALAEAKTACDS